MSWLEHHTLSENHASRAYECLRQQEDNRAVEFYRLAADEELEALKTLGHEKTRTLGITAVSAVSLYYKAKEFAIAKRTAHQYLALDFLPPFAIQELEELLQTLLYEESRIKSGIQFVEGEVLVSVSGGEILYGAAPLDLILQKVEKIRSIFYRTTEYLLEQPLRLRGSPSQNIKRQCDPWLLQAPPGSYQFAVRVRKPEDFEQLTIDGIHNPELRVEQITKKFLEIVKASTLDPEGELTEIVPQEEYRETFLKLTRELAPPLSGKSFEQMEIRASSDVESIPVILSPDTRQAIRNVLRKQETLPPQESTEQRATQLKGVLRGLQLDRDWIEINADNNKSIKIYDAKEEIDDVIGSMVNQQVVVDVVEHMDASDDKKYFFRDIQLEEDLL
jgi:hypothetical protein